MLDCDTVWSLLWGTVFKSNDNSFLIMDFLLSSPLSKFPQQLWHEDTLAREGVLYCLSVCDMTLMVSSVENFSILAASINTCYSLNVSVLLLWFRLEIWTSVDFDTKAVFTGWSGSVLTPKPRFNTCRVLRHRNLFGNTYRNYTSVMWKHEAYRGQKVRKEPKIVKETPYVPQLNIYHFLF